MKRLSRSRAKYIEKQEAWSGKESGRWLWDASRKLRDDNLQEFWDRWKQFTVITPMQARLELLKSMTTQVYQINAMRRLDISRARGRYNTLKRFEFEMDGECGCCGAPVEIRHHIVPIKNGGHNHKLNLLGLCKVCHAEIHEWLKED